MAVSPAIADLRGHLKAQTLYQRFPSDSVLRDQAGADTSRSAMELRLNVSARRDAWHAEVHWQALGTYREAALAATTGGIAGGAVSEIDDERRWLSLTDTVTSKDSHRALHRLDRFNIGYSGEQWIWRLGRQAVSWGNGLLFNPVDVFNPFDPAAVDKEYKTGDDMLYGQYLAASGDDLQLVAVARRDPDSGDVTRKVGSLALKYHGTIGTTGYDIIAARHHRDNLLGFGWSRDVADAVWAGDIVVNHGAATTVSLVSNLSWSTVWRERNVSALVEYLYSGFGKTGDIDGSRLRADAALGDRLARGELFTIARQYAAASAAIEVTPLWQVVASGFFNLADPSGLVQLTSRYDWRQNLQLLAAINLPVGGRGTEFGGIEIFPGKTIATDGSLFLQLGWYF